MIPPPPDGSGVVATQAPPPPPDGSGVVAVSHSDPGMVASHDIQASPGGVSGWLHDLEGDVKYGQDRTFIGKALKKLGAQGTNVGAQAGAGGMLTSPVLGPIHTAQGVAEMPDHPVRGAWDAVKGVGETATIPSMIADPMGASSTAALAENVAGKVAKGAGAVTKALSKGAVTKGLQSNIGGTLDSVAQAAGVDTSSTASLSQKSKLVSDALKGQAQQTYGELDKMSGGRYQRFQDEIDRIHTEIRTKYMSTDAYTAAQDDLAKVTKEFSDLQSEMVAKGVDPKIIKDADAKWAQAKALETVGKKLRTAESLNGDLKPGTSSVDTGLKNLKPHILPQATNDANAAAAISSHTQQATQQLRSVKRNRTVLGALGGGGAAVGAIDYLAGRK